MHENEVMNGHIKGEVTMIYRILTGHGFETKRVGTEACNLI